MKPFYNFKLLLLIVSMAMLSVRETRGQLAIDLAGPGNSVTFPFNWSGNFTIEYDMYMHSLINFNAGLTLTCISGSDPVDFYFDASGNAGFIQGFCGASNGTSYPGYSSETWYHITYVYNYSLGQFEFYINGILMGTFGGHYYGGSYLSNGIIGDRLDGNTNANAKFDNVKIWSVARTPSEILSDMTGCFSGNEPGLDIYYTMEEGSGTTIFDHAIGNGAQNGTLVGTATWSSGLSYTASSSNINVESCGAYTSPSGNYIWTTSGTYLDTIPNHFGCDSTMTINLIVNDAFEANSNLIPSTYNVCNSGSITVDLTNTKKGYYYYLINATSGGTQDGPLFGNDGTITFNTSLASTLDFTVQSYKGPAVDLSDEEDLVRFNSPFSAYGNEITIEAWVDFDGGYPWAGQATAELDDPATDVWLWHNGSFMVNDASTGWVSLAFPSLPTGYNHVATVADATGLYIYYNGSLVASNTTGIATAIVNNPGSVIDLGQDPRYPIGTPNRNSDNGFDDFMVWNTALTPSEIIATISTCDFSGYSDLVQRTEFNDGFGTSVSSTVGSNGEIINPSNNWVPGLQICACDQNFSDTITVTVNSSSPTVLDVQTACNSYTWIDGNTYTSSTSSPTHTLTNMAGCDSVIVLSLTIQNVDATITNNSPTLSANATGATYQWIDCGNGFTSISGSTNQNFTATSNGDYAVVVTQNGCTDTSTCVTINNVGIEENDWGSFMAVYPNPTNGEITIDLGAFYDEVNVTVSNIIEQNIASKKYTATDKLNLTIDGSKGIYFVHIESSGKSAFIKVIKK